MASIRYRNDRWIVDIRRKGFESKSKSFMSKLDAEIWAAQTEEIIDAKKKEDLAHLAPPTNKKLQSKEDIYSLPRISRDGCMGICFLFLNGECVYVGRSVMIHGRVDKHLKRVPFDSYSWLAIPEWDISAIEMHYIKLLRPKYNVVHNN